MWSEDWLPGVRQWIDQLDLAVDGRFLGQLQRPDVGRMDRHAFGLLVECAERRFEFVRAEYDAA